MRITYVCHSRFPTEKAHGHQIAAVCSAMARLGHEVRLLAPSVKNSIDEHPQTYHGMAASVLVEKLPSFDALNARFVPEALALHLSMHSYRKFLKRALKDRPTDLLYTRSLHTVRSCLRTGIPTMLELHALPRWRTAAFVRACDACAKVICLTEQQRETLRAWGVKEDRITVEHDGVDLRQFTELPMADEAKEEWRLPRHLPVVGYVGSLQTGHGLKKGIDELIEATALLKHKKIPLLCWIVGGPAAAVSAYRAQAAMYGLGETDIRFEGPIAPALVPRAIGACDVCVYPAPRSNHPFFRRDTSPLKLFEYLAAGKPIVCADVPTIRDVVDASIVTLCEPGNAASLAQGIAKALQSDDRGTARTEREKAIAKAHDWESRMERILS